jgi:hypothetical protein
MNLLIDHTRLHRTAKYFMDNGRAETHADAMGLLSGFGLAIMAGPEVAFSPSHQVALLTLVNVARRTFLAGVDVRNLPDAQLLVPLARAITLADAIRELGGSTTETGDETWPMACVGSCVPHERADTSWQLTWQGWRGGVVPSLKGQRLAEDSYNPLCAAMAAAVCAAELFSWHAKDHPMAGRRTAGLSLWNPGADWLASDASEPAFAYLPSRLWLIGLGNLGQAFAWLLACLPYADRSQIEFLLQDFDEVAESNDSTSVLSSLQAVGQKKTRLVSEWLEAAGFKTAMEERRFGSWIARGPHDPAVALCGVDNAATRAELGKSGFELVVEAGLGAGTGGFRNFSVHSFPASRRPEEIWSNPATSLAPNVASMPAYKALHASGLDACGLAQLASRTVGVPFVGLIAAALALSEPLRRLHGAGGRELLSGSVASLGDIEKVELPFVPYGSGHVRSGLIA